MLRRPNDAFAGLNAIEIPQHLGTYVYNGSLPYDAGTEAKDKLVRRWCSGRSRHSGRPQRFFEARVAQDPPVRMQTERYIHRKRTGRYRQQRRQQ